MASIKNLEMAAALSADSRIEIKKSLFSTKGIHTPSGQKLEVVVNEYDANGAATVETLLAAKPEKLAAEIERVGVPHTSPIGCLRMEAVMTPDHQFAAVQGFRYTDLRYKPVTDLVIVEGADAETLCRLF